MADIICQQKVENAQGGFDNLIPNKAINCDNATNAINAKQAVYDLTIRTQAEFEAMYNSPTWLGAKSVCFIGNGGTLKFTRSDGQGLKIPQNVHNILGLNNAIIEVTNFVFNFNVNEGALWYKTQPTAGDYSIYNLEVNCISTSGGYGFVNCSNLTNCTGTGTGIYGYGFDNCSNLSNCIGTGTGTDTGYGFYSCSNLTNCTGTGADGYGFVNCSNLSNCIGTGTGTDAGYGFYSCSNLTNCTGTGTSTGTGADGYGFVNCSYCNGCRKSTTPSTTGIWGGTITKRDDSSCDLD